MVSVMGLGERHGGRCAVEIALPVPDRLLREPGFSSVASLAEAVLSRKYDRLL